MNKFLIVNLIVLNSSREKSFGKTSIGPLSRRLILVTETKWEWNFEKGERWEGKKNFLVDAKKCWRCIFRQRWRHCGQSQSLPFIMDGRFVLHPCVTSQGAKFLDALISYTFACMRIKSFEGFRCSIQKLISQSSKRVFKVVLECHILNLFFMSREI